MTEARRGEIWSVDLDAPVGHEQGYRRPALVISSNRWNRTAQKVVVLPMTRSGRARSLRIEVEPSDRNGLVATSYIRCDDIRAISIRRMEGRLGRVGVEEMHAVERTLSLFLEI